MSKSNALTISLLIVILFSTATWAVEDKLNDYSFGISAPVLFNDIKEAEVGESFSYRIKSDKPGKIFVELIDIYVDSNNSKKFLPLGSTPYSPKDYVFIKNNEIDFQPSVDFQTINIEFYFDNIENLDKSIIGGLRVTAKTYEELEATTKVDQITVGFNAIGTFSY